MDVIKGFRKDMTCLGFQYEEGKTYEEPKAKLCAAGFHAVERPLDVFGYYAPASSVYHICELSGVSGERSDDSKVCGTSIKIGAEIGIPDLVKAHIEYVKKHCMSEQNANRGKPAIAGIRGAATAGNHGVAITGDRGAATAGDYGEATAGNSGAAVAGDRGSATAGDCGAATAGVLGVATAGDRGAAIAGDRGAATAGDCGAAVAGDYGAATAGNSGAATAGDHGAATASGYGTATAGDYSAATVGGHGAASAGDCGAVCSRGLGASGADGAVLVRGNGVKAKGDLGSVLVIVEEDRYSYGIASWCAGVVDGNNLKPNTWYKCKDGKFVEVDG